MSEHYGKAEIHVWMPMIGFEKNDWDKGARRIINQISFAPDGLSAFLFHPDIVMQHNGMETERILPPDNCSYYGSPRNDERFRQEWTNYNLRELVYNLHDEGTIPYLGIMGVSIGNRWHEEWITSHPEVRLDVRGGQGSYNVLKHMDDGTLFEDFFTERLCQTLIDYGFGGLQVADNFCPQGTVIYNGDFSADMINQFTEHTGIELPADLISGMNEDTNENKNLRGDWLWKDHRAEWIKFWAWRWAAFWRKVCAALHSIGKKVIVLGMYCTDPFETLYCLGIDLKQLAETGIDYFMPNIVPTGLFLDYPEWGYRFHRYMLMAPFTSAFAPETKLVSLLGVRDCTEEWDVLHHVPCCLERDIYTLSGFMRVTSEGYKRCLEGLMICLGDGVRDEEWKWLTERFDVGFYDEKQVLHTLSPTLVWSDHAFYNTLPEYIRTRRWTAHKFVYDAEDRGSLTGAIVRIEDLDYEEGTLYIPNFDLLPDDEKDKIAAYTRGPVICTAAAERFTPETVGIHPDIYFEDKFSVYPMCAFSFQSAVSDETRQKIENLCAQDDGKDNIAGDPADIAEFGYYVLHETLNFTKVTAGFAESVAYLLRNTGCELFTCSHPMTVTKLKNGHYRLYIYNPEVFTYAKAVVSCIKPIRSVEILSKYPLLPVKYLHSSDGYASFLSSESDGTQCHFKTRIAPGGAVILEAEI